MHKSLGLGLQIRFQVGLRLQCQVQRDKNALIMTEMDHISKLPDAVLCHILSFIPTKSAVVTSILSRRWISLWTKVPVLDFTERPESAKFYLRDFAIKNFKRFVDKVLLHNDTSSILRLNFEIFNELNLVWANSLINTLLMLDSLEIYLSKERAIQDKVHIQLPMDLLYRERLRVLKLRGPFDIHNPSNLHLPRLETLNLCEVNFLGEGVVKIVTSGCAALKELVTEFCDGIRILDIASLTLKMLKVRGVRCQTFSVKAPTVGDLFLDLKAEKYNIGELSSLVEAKIEIDGKHPQALELTRRISHVQILRLQKSTVALFGGAGDAELPTFSNLTLLDIQISLNMLHMLKCPCPKLMNLIVDVGPSLNDETGQILSETTPLCLSWIPKIEIRNFGGYINDTTLVRYLLENVAALKELKLHMHQISMKRERDALRKLISFTRVSRTCQVIVCSSASSCGDTSPFRFA